MFGGGGSMHVDEELFGAYVFYGALLVLKMLIMAPLTARQRLSNKVTIFTPFFCPVFPTKRG